MFVQMKRIFLLGYMGTGKTTLGRVLGDMTGFTFVDLDCFIEQRYCASISQLFETHGEAKFREIEQQILHEVAEFEQTIISCGGGTPCFFDNMEFMNSKGETVFLDSPIKVLSDRLKIARYKRPILKDLNDEELMVFIEKSLATREPFYSKAKHTFNAALLDNKEQITEATSKLKELLNL